MSATPNARKVWILEFEGMPANDNDRRSWHWSTRAKHDEEWHGRVWLACLDLRVAKDLKKIRVSAVFVRRALGVADPDNDRARLKPLIDGLVLAGVVPNDNYRYVDLGSCTEERGPSGLRLIVEDLSAEAEINPLVGRKVAP